MGPGRRAQGGRAEAGLGASPPIPRDPCTHTQHTQLHTCMLTPMPAQLYTSTPTPLYARSHRHTQLQVHSCLHGSRTHTHAHTCMHTHSRTLRGHGVHAEPRAGYTGLDLKAVGDRDANDESGGQEDQVARACDARAGGSVLRDAQRQSCPSTFPQASLSGPAPPRPPATPTPTPPRVLPPPRWAAAISEMRQALDTQIRAREK